MLNAAMLLKIMGMLGGRKFIVTTATGLILGFVPGLQPEVAISLAGVAASFILGQAYTDGQSGGATSTAAIVSKM
jgi:hypothetical protein